ncbi:MAG: hypothetical protein J0G32_00775 [Alphaproteobacteria bacterium]|nr:hypothetical protein [Alphaproteobacteria bacterium]OJV14106.1 MAG: hypothetical protein BGO27_01300 [Alphaproteobacteria bacterium 33-17]
MSRNSNKNKQDFITFKDLETKKTINLKTVISHTVADGQIKICEDDKDIPNIYILNCRNPRYIFVDYIVSKNRNKTHVTLVTNTDDKEHLVYTLKKLDQKAVSPMDYYLQDKTRYSVKLQNTDVSNELTEIISLMLYLDTEVDRKDFFYTLDATHIPRFHFNKSLADTKLNPKLDEYLADKQIMQYNFGNCLKRSELQIPCSEMFKYLVSHKIDMSKFHEISASMTKNYILDILESSMSAKYYESLIEHIDSFYKTASKVDKHIDKRILKTYGFTSAYNFNSIIVEIKNSIGIQYNKCLDFSTQIQIEKYIIEDNSENLLRCLKSNPEFSQKPFNWCFDGNDMLILDNISMSITEYIRQYHPQRNQLLSDLIKYLDSDYRSREDSNRLNIELKDRKIA